MHTTVILVCGGRSFGDTPASPDDGTPAWTEQNERGAKERACLTHVLDTELAINNSQQHQTAIINGGATGADYYARKWALANEIPCVTYPAKWKQHGLAAGPIRNQEMLTSGLPTMVVAFPGGKGTADMVSRAKAANIPVLEITP